jgi:hypothetical protein
MFKVAVQSVQKEGSVLRGILLALSVLFIALLLLKFARLAYPADPQDLAYPQARRR